MNSDNSLVDVEKRYRELAESFAGTSGEILTAMRAFVRKEARDVLRDDPTRSKRRLAEEFRAIADRCYEVAVTEKWMNDYALNIGDSIRSAVMSVRL
jgi:hypothetical protein